VQLLPLQHQLLHWQLLLSLPLLGLLLQELYQRSCL
jgi:hypothetical protein